MQKKHLIGYPATALVALGIGAAGASGSGTPTAAGPIATPTVTQTVPGAATTVAGPATTVAGPATTVTARATQTVTAPAPPPPPPPAPAVAMGGDGIYQVGVDVQPGVYKSTAADSGNCYWSRLSGPDTGNDILDNGNSSGQVLVTIAKSDKFFESSGCNAWTKR